jgi:NAD(P)-dependent dehydrogenase (short-subunit alcohol dehydrogenase family)
MIPVIMSFLGLEGYHVFVTGAAGGIGGQAVNTFLGQGCKVTAHDLRPITNIPASKNLFTLFGDISSEESIKSCIAKAKEHHGPINILIANAGITDESNSYPLWQLPIELWEKTYNTNIRGTFLTIKHFLISAEESQNATGHELENLAIVVTGSECGKFGQAGHAEYASGKAGLQYGLIRGVKNEIVRLNRKARINAVAPGWCSPSRLVFLQIVSTARHEVPLQTYPHPLSLVNPSLVNPRLWIIR